MQNGESAEFRVCRGQILQSAESEECGTKCRMENCESLECHLAGCVQECARSVHRAGCHHGQAGLTGGKG